MNRRHTSYDLRLTTAAVVAKTLYLAAWLESANALGHEAGLSDTSG